jgi:GcrA cell cycle regulator
MRLPSIWDDPVNIERLVVMWETAGLPAAEIGKILGVSKSAIIGKAHRLGLVDRAPPRTARLLKIEQDIEQPPQIPQMRTNKRPLAFPVPPSPPPPPPEPAYGTLKLLALRHNSCRWPEGDGPIFVFCGRPRHHESSYCAEHHAMAHARGSQRDYDRAAEQALAGKLFSSRAGVEQ